MNNFWIVQTQIKRVKPQNSISREALKSLDCNPQVGDSTSQIEHNKADIIREDWLETAKRERWRVTIEIPYSKRAEKD